MKPDSTAVRTALWRARHVELDASPHVFEDTLGRDLAAPEEGWRDRGDMHPEGTKPFRASIVGRARLIEDLVMEESARGIEQYVLLGAGLDTFAQRRRSTIRIFEIDRAEPQAWKKERLAALGLPAPIFVPVDFEAGESWRERLVAAGFDPAKPAVVASAGVSMYLTREANFETMREAASFAPGSTFAMTFLQPLERADDSARPGLEQSVKGARASGTPFVSFFVPDDLVALAKKAGFREVEHVSASAIAERYFAGRADGLRPPNNAEEFVIGRT